ncbi:hypothetical protein ACTL6U_08350 [Rhodovibrionaceae bacterium A322]
MKRSGLFFSITPVGKRCVEHTSQLPAAVFTKTLGSALSSPSPFLFRWVLIQAERDRLNNLPEQLFK